ncbi:MAG: hypothetical protein NZ853_08235 [Leptospiraceae bacterium]|nr:hypothetical protein [Leptospiraceae bacterium]MDW7976837.1 hypothetical protein [Leptospiraceae bacterium]
MSRNNDNDNQLIIMTLTATTIILMAVVLNMNSKKNCDSQKTSYLVLTKTPFEVRIRKQRKEYYLDIKKDQIQRSYVASSYIVNFFQKVVPLCSDIIYDISKEYFTESFCFEADDYSICRGKTLQKGYPVAIKKNNEFSSRMFILDTYPWSRIEEALKEDNEKKIQEIESWIDTKIFFLPEKSYVKRIKIIDQDQKQFFLIRGPKNEWILQNRNVSSSTAVSFVNSVITLRQLVDLNQLQDIQIPDKPYWTIEFDLGFDEWKFSLFVRSKFQAELYVDEEKQVYVIKFDGQVYPISKDYFDAMKSNFELLLKEFESPKEQKE